MVLLHTLSIFYIILLVLHQNRSNMLRYNSNLDVISGRRHGFGSTVLKVTSLQKQETDVS